MKEELENLNTIQQIIDALGDDFGTLERTKKRWLACYGENNMEWEDGVTPQEALLKVLIKTKT